MTDHVQDWTLPEIDTAEDPAIDRLNGEGSDVTNGRSWPGPDDTPTTSPIQPIARADTPDGSCPTVNGPAAEPLVALPDGPLDESAAQAIAHALGFAQPAAESTPPAAAATGSVDDPAELIFRALVEGFPAPPVLEPTPAEPTPQAPLPGVQEPPPDADDRSTLLRSDGRLFDAVPKRPEATRVRPMAGVHATARSLLRQRKRLLLSVIAVAIGVGYLAGSLTLLRRVGNGLAAQVGEGSETADLVIEGSISLDTPLEQVRRLVPSTIEDAVRTVDGVSAVEPRLEATAIVIGAEGEAVVGLGLTERPIGINWPDAAELNNYELQAGGNPPALASEVVIDADTARTAGVAIGDVVKIATKTTTADFTVTGIVAIGDAGITEGTTLAIFETATARELFQLEADNNAIAIAIDDGADADAVSSEISTFLPPGSEITDGETYTEHRVVALAKSFTLIRSLLVGFAGLALVVGAFTVANSMALLFEHRRRGFAMLRLLGASREQLMAAAATEALIAGLIAGVIGLGLGLMVGWGIEQAIAQMGTPLPVAGSPISWQIPLAAVGLGGVVTLLTSLAPARSAATTPPLHAITEGAAPSPARSVLSRAWGVVRRPLAVAVGVGAATWYLSRSPALAAVLVAVGFALALVSAQLPRALSGVVGSATHVILGRSVALRRASSLTSVHARRRTSATTAALLMATAVIAGLAILSASFVQSIDGQVTNAVTADLVVDSGTIARGGLAADLLPELQGIDGVESVSGLRVGRAQIDGYSTRIGAMNGRSVFDLIDLGLTEGTPEALGEQDIAISTTTADSTGLGVGDTALTTFENGTSVDMTVVAIYENDLTSILGEAVIDTDVLARELPQSIDVVAFVGLDDTATDDTIRFVEATAELYGAAGVLEPSELVGNRAEFLSGFARVIQWMLAFTVLLALIGVANTLQLGVNERRRELGLLRAVGASRRQVLRIVMSEAAAMSITGTLLGLALGFALAFAAVRALGRYGLTDFVVPTASIIALAFFAIGFGLLGAVVPAVRASRIPLLDAIADHQDAGRRRPRSRETPAPAPGPTALAASTPSAAPTSHSVEDGFPHAHVDESPLPDESETDQIMALRCVQCGEDPGAGERCQVCGTHQPPQTGGMFSVSAGASPAPHMHSDAAPPANATYDTSPYDASSAAGTAVPTPVPDAFAADDDIADAEIVEEIDAGLVNEVRPEEYLAPVSEPPPPAEPVEPIEPPVYAVHPESNPTPVADAPLAETVSPPEETTSAQLGSIFQDRGVGSTPDSPFGRFANDPPAASPANERYSTTDPVEEEIDSFVPYSPPQPAPRHEALSDAPSSFGSGFRRHGSGHQPGGHLAPPHPDRHGLANAVSALAQSSQTTAHAVWMVVGALLENNEAVHYAVAGTSLGMSTAAVSTNRRVIVVSERRWLPEIETFELDGDLLVHGRHSNGQASLTFSQRDTVVTVDQIQDVPVAVALAESIAGG